MRHLLAAVLAFAFGCSDGMEDLDSPPQLNSDQFELSASVELERVTAIRDVAAGEGLTNAALLAGVAKSETSLAHCWSEATWACKGPTSPSCGGGAVIAGSGDGACSLQQGGLGMFQFDGGTYAQTLARDGDEILLLEGNIAHGVEFVGEIVDQSVGGLDGTADAIAWMNDIDMVAGDAELEQWAATMACRYNGCCSSSSLCSSRRRGYRDNALAMYSKYGASFWDDVDDGGSDPDPDADDDGTDEEPPIPEPDCPTVPRDGGTIDDGDTCFWTEGEGDAWHTEDAGFADGSHWTLATDEGSGTNIGRWKIYVEEAGRYEVSVHLDGGVLGRSTAARYQIEHADGEDDVTIDQGAAGTGFVSLGEFNFTPKLKQRIKLEDYTGEADDDIAILFDAVRLTRVSDFDDGEVDLGGRRHATGGVSGGAGCAAAGGASALDALPLLALALGLGRRRRRREK
jgi:hypothetical protein